MPTTAELNTEMIRISRLLDDKLEDLVKLSHRAAETERDYRKAKAQAFATFRRQKLVSPDLVAQVDGEIADLRYDRDLADSLKSACRDAVLSLKAQLSALQTIASGVKAEAELARYGPS